MQALLHAGERTSRHEMVDTDFAMAMAAATPGLLGGGCWALRHCVDDPAFGGSILRDDARPELLPRNPHCSHIARMEGGHLYPGDGDSGVVVLIRASGSDLVASDVGSRGNREYWCHHWFANFSATTCRGKRPTKTVISGTPTPGRKYPAIYGRYSGEDQENDNFKSCRIG